MAKRRPIEQRFWEKIDRISHKSGCWVWLAARHKFGYGRLSLPGRPSRHIYAHRFSWILHYGSIPDGLCVLHRCDNPACANPEHLFLGTRCDNCHDRENKGRGTFGETHPQAKLCEKDVVEIRKAKLSGVQLATKFGVSPMLITRIRKGRIWKHIL